MRAFPQTPDDFVKLEFVPKPEKPVGREGLKRKSFFAAKRQKRLERKARPGAHRFS
jgi:hypothetical protein